MKRTMGRSGIEASAIGMGCWAIGGVFYRGDTPVGWGEVDDRESDAAISAAIEHGITLFDTANIYGAGHSERVLGNALAGRREKVIIATKFWTMFDEETREVTGASASPADIRTACDQSLRRLKTDYIDLYQFHNGGYPAEDAGEVIETLESLVDEGKIRSYGWSTDDPARARAFAEGAHCTAVQFQLNALRDNAEMVALCDELDLAGLNRGPLAMGLLTGKYTRESTLPDNDVRGPNAPEWMRYFENGRPSQEFLNRLESIREILTSNGRTLAQGALAWLLARSGRTFPIPGIRTVKQAAENAGALEKGPLTGQQMSEIAELLG